MRCAGQTAQSPCSTSYVTSTRTHGGRTRIQPVRCADQRIEDRVASRPVQPGPIVVKSIPTTRAAAPPPKPVPVEHSSAYLLQNRRKLAANGVDEEAQPRDQQQQQPEAFTGSAVEWVLKKADQSLDEIEENPPEYAKVIYDISSGPIGKAASVGVTTAAKVTVQVGTEAIKAAAPVGKWALQQGFKLAVGAVTKGLAAGSSKKDSKKDK